MKWLICQLFMLQSKVSSDPTAAPSPWQQTFEKSVSVKSETGVVKEGESSEADMVCEFVVFPSKRVILKYF